MLSVGRDVFWARFEIGAQSFIGPEPRLVLLESKGPWCKEELKTAGPRKE